MLQGPIAEIRNRIGLNQRELADKVNLSQPTLEYIEKGAYDNLPVGLLQFLITYDEDIEIKWKQWKLMKRLNWVGPTELAEGFPWTPDICHPHMEWREVHCKLNLTHYAEELCVHRSKIQSFEEGRTKKFPRDLEAALIMACGNTLTQQLKKECEIWVNVLKSHPQRKNTNMSIGWILSIGRMTEDFRHQN